MNDKRRKFLLEEATQLVKELWCHTEDGDLTTDAFFDLRERARIFFREVEK
jgi:hypothetical protein